MRGLQMVGLAAEHALSAVQAPFDRFAAALDPGTDPVLEFERTGEVGPDPDGEFCPGWPTGATSTPYISQEITR